MAIIHDIRSTRKEGWTVAAIARELKVNKPTVRKCLKERGLFLEAAGQEVEVVED